MAVDARTYLPPRPAAEFGVTPRPEFLLIAVAVYLAPFNALRHPAIYVTLSDCLFVLALGVMLLSGRLPLAPLGFATVPWLASAVALIAGLLLSSTVAGSAERGLIVGGQYLFAYALLPFAILGRSESETATLVKVFVWSILVICWFGIALYYYGFQAGFDKGYRFVSGAGRMASVIEKPNAAASLFAITVPMALYLWNTQRMGLIFTAVAVATLVKAILLTGSNTGLAVLAIGLLAFLVLNMSVRLAAATALAGFALFVAISVWGTSILPEPFLKRVMPAIESGSLDDAGSFEHRRLLVEEAFEIGEGTLLLGHGADSYREVSRYGAPVHNIYLLLMTEGGFLSLFGWLGLITTVSLAGVTAFGAGKHVAAATCATAILIFALTATATAHMYARFWVVPLLLVVGLATSAITAARAKDTGEAP